MSRISVGIPPLPVVALALSVCAACANADSDKAPIDGDSCRQSTDCPDGEVCQDGRCIRSNDRCSDDEECPEGSSCERGVCTTPDAGADADADADECLRQSDCPDGFDCINNTCQAPDADAGLEDPPDVDGEIDASEDPDASSDPDAEVVPDSPDECEGRDDGRLGDTCDGAADCCNGLCLGNPDVGYGYCTEPCASYDDCNPLGIADDFFCYDAGAAGRLCARSDYENACDVADDCLGGICLKGLGTTGCSWTCTSTADCPPSSACGLVGFLDGSGNPFYLDVCAPVGNNCAVDSGTGLNNCLSGTCVTPDEGGIGFCTVFCRSSDPDACPAGYACEAVDPEQPDTTICNRIGG